MTLRDTYYDGLSGLQTQLLDAFTNGAAAVTTNATAITNGLTLAASQGQTVFSINIPVTFKPTALRLKGTMMLAFLDGINHQLAVEEIMGFECTPVLNTSNTQTLSVDLNFAFTP